MTKYSLKPTGIFHVQFTDILGLKEAKAYMDDFKKIEYLSSPVKILYDIREAKLNFEMDELPSLTHFAEDSTKQYAAVRAAYLVNDPKNTAYGFVFKNLPKSKRTSRNIFSTIKAAEAWLLKEDD